MAFPDINDNITEVNTTPEYATIKSEFEGGYQQTRERHSRNRQLIEAKYFLSTADKNLLISHYNSVRGSTAFDWTHPEDNITYTVRYEKAPKVPSKGKTYGWHEVSITLREV